MHHLLAIAMLLMQGSPAPVCMVQQGDAVIANYGGASAQAACSALSAQHGVPSPNWSLECVFADDPDFVRAFAYGHAWVVFDLSLTGFSTAHDICTNAQASGAIVVDANFVPYDPQNTP